MKIFKNWLWKLTTLILLVLVVLVIRSYFYEYQKNKPHKKELKALKNFLEKTKKENLEFRKEFFSSYYPLEREKIIKDKFGEAEEGEKIIFISEDVLKSIELPFLP